jgi:hypothetical protein
MVSRTNADSPSAPLRKSTGLVATITRTAPVGPITCRLYNARSTTIKVSASAPRPTRIITPSTSTSIVPARASTLPRAASQTTAVAIIHGVELLHRPSPLFAIAATIITPRPPPPSTGEHFQPADRLDDSIMFSVHSKPNGQNQAVDSQITSSSGRWVQNNAYGLAVKDSRPKIREGTSAVLISTDGRLLFQQRDTICPKFQESSIFLVRPAKVTRAFGLRRARSS